MLSKRLSLIASLVPKGARVCDIGTDHARLPIYLTQNLIASFVIASDIAEKPLEFAKENIRKSGAKNIETRLGNGLSTICDNEVDTAIIAGMGGQVIAEILKSGKHISENENILFIFQPTTSPEILRKYLLDNGFEIYNDIPLSENEKIYSVITAKFKNTPTFPSAEYYYIGNITADTEDGKLYIKKQLKRIEAEVIALKNIPERKDDFLNLNKIFISIKNLLE